MIEQLKEIIPALSVKKIDDFPTCPFEWANLLMKIHYGNAFAPRHTNYSEPMKNHIRKEYDPFIAELIEGDEVYYYDSTSAFCGWAGFIIVRDGKIVARTYSIKSKGLP